MAEKKCSRCGEVGDEEKLFYPGRRECRHCYIRRVQNWQRRNAADVRRRRQAYSRRQATEHQALREYVARLADEGVEEAQEIIEAHSKGGTRG